MSIPSSQASDEYDDSLMPLGRLGFLPGDRSVVTKPVMRSLDALFLAPLDSPLFGQKFRVKRNAEGQKKLRKNPEMDEDSFRTLIDPTIRRLVRNSRSTDPRLRDRYYNAALAVAKKRRANHTQWWRRYNKHKELIYGGQELYDAKYGNKWKGKVVKKVKAEKLDTANAPQQKVSGNMTPPTSTKKRRPSAPRK